MGGRSRRRGEDGWKKQEEDVGRNGTAIRVRNGDWLLLGASALAMIEGTAGLPLRHGGYGGRAAGYNLGYGCLWKLLFVEFATLGLVRTVAL